MISINKFLGILAGCFGLLLSSCTGREQALPDHVDFNFHIKPILSDRCFACHGPDEKTREADLALHTHEGAFALLDSSGHYVISPGNVDASELYHRIISDDPEFMMPPPSFNLELSGHEKKLIRKWIEQGAEWKDHWAFIPPAVPTIPAARDEHWDDNPVDAFVWEKMSENNLDPSPRATSHEWLRRVSYDLTGLPPGPQILARFPADANDDMYEVVVDSLLASTSYGERMASIWLDIARYADSHGYQDDRPRTMWPWRDWVVDAFNENMPYDSFVIHQLAGDLLPEASYKATLATGFNRNHPITQEGGVIDEEYLNEYAADRLQTFSTAFLGLTMQCARCHDHKYDPISQKDFYALMGYFNNVSGEQGRISYFDQAPVPSITMEDSSHQQYIQRIEELTASAEEKLRQIIKQERESFAGWRQRGDFDFTISESAKIAQYNFEESSWQFVDSISNTDQATANLNLPPEIPLPEKVRGMKGKGIQFDGDNFITVGEVGDFNHHSSFTIATWIKSDGISKLDEAIFGRRNGEQWRQGYDCSILKNGRVAFRLIHNLFAEKIEVRTLKKFPNGWQHLAVSYDGSGKADGVKIYFNGVRQMIQILQDDLQGKSILNGNDLLVGHWNHRARIINNQHGFEGGVIDDFRVYNQKLSDLQIQQLAGRAVTLTDEKLYDHYLNNASERYVKAKKTLDSLKALDITTPMVMVMEERDTILPTFVLDRGQYDAKLERVYRTTPKAILEFNEEENNRLGLAKWLFDANNPLTARVMVNRLWLQCFGEGLVSTVEDFGNQGELPSHPELLEYLSVEFMKDWDIQKLLKRIVLSETYRQTARANAKKRKMDPSNRWLSRGPHSPLSAEMLRDQALATSDLLYKKKGGKWVKPYQPAGIWKELANQIGENKYRVSVGRDKYRRSLYTYWKRTIPPPTMLTLDAPERSVCTVKRQATSTPLQALILLNDPTYVEASRVLAQRLHDQHQGVLEKIIEGAFYRIVSRPADAEDLNKLRNFYHSSSEHYRHHPDEAESLLCEGGAPPSLFEDPAAGAALATTISLIYNLDEAKFH